MLWAFENEKFAAAAASSVFILFEAGETGREELQKSNSAQGVEVSTIAQRTHAILSHLIGAFPYQLVQKFITLCLDYNRNVQKNVSRQV